MSDHTGTMIGAAVPEGLTAAYELLEQSDFRLNRAGKEECYEEKNA